MSLSKRFFLLGSILLMATLLFTFSPKAPSAHAASASVSIGCPPTQSQGASNTWVKVIQYRLNSLSYNQVFSSLNFHTLTTDGVFGSATKSGVIAFQNASGLSPDGSVGTLTWSMMGLCNIGSAHFASGYIGSANCPPTQSQGANNTFVNAMQHMLNMDVYYGLIRNSGWYPLSMDGSFGPHTVSAVLDFQYSNKLTQDGQVGPNTWGAFGMCV